MKMLSGRNLSEERRCILKASFDRGDSASYAGRLAGTNPVTAAKYFRSFGWDGTPRPGRRKPGVPVYTGPDWIGEAINQPTADLPVAAIY